MFFDNVRNQSNDYQPLATFLSTVYEILQKISRVNPLYQFNMLQLNRIVDVALQKSQLTRPAAASTQARVDEIKSIVTKEIFQRSCDALFQGILTNNRREFGRNQISTEILLWGGPVKSIH